MGLLQDGIEAPSFTAKSVFGEEVSLPALKGKKVMLSFYRYASCPLCNLRVNELIGKYNDWSGQGLEMIAVFQSPENSIKKYVGKQEPPFPILADPTHQLYKKYGVEGGMGKFLVGVTLRPRKMLKAFGKGFLPGKMETDITMVPADFLIDEEGKIHTAYYGKDASDHLAVEFIDEFIHS